VPLKEELSHADNYIKMQQIKYPDNIYYMIDSDPQFDNVLLPHLIFETFVENIFKYAFIYGKLLSVFIKTQAYNFESESFVQITIEDNGCGFPPDYLKNFQYQKRDGSHIGIQNIQKTLSLFYGRDDLLQLSNNETGGAMVKILIPL
jgi:two-component system, sensor histidine kinase YesM